MDRERKMLYLIAVIAPIFQMLTLINYQETKETLRRAMAAANNSTVCEEHLLRTMVQCHGIRQWHPDRVLGTAPGDG
jgi:hypothetical protein